MTHDEGHGLGHGHDEAEADSIVTGLLITRKVDGDITAVFDARTAAIAGAACGAVYFFLKMLFHR